MENYFIESVNIFYPQYESEYVEVKFQSGEILNIEGELYGIYVGNKYIQSNIFIMSDSFYIREDLLNVIKKSNLDIEIVTKNEFLEIIKNQEKFMQSISNGIKVKNVDINTIEISIGNYPDSLVFTLKSGVRFAVDGTIISQIEGQIVNYKSAFLMRGNVYPCDADGYGITDKDVLRNDYVNKGFLIEVTEYAGRTNYELAPEFSEAIINAIHVYNEKKDAKIKIITEDEYIKQKQKNKFEELSNDILKLFQKNTLVTVYNYEEQKNVLDLVDKAKKKAGSDIVLDNIESKEALKE